MNNRCADILRERKRGEKDVTAKIQHARGFAADGEHHCVYTANPSVPWASWQAEHQEDGTQNTDTLWRNVEANRHTFTSWSHGESPWKNVKTCDIRLSSTSDPEWEKNANCIEWGWPVSLPHPMQITTFSSFVERELAHVEACLHKGMSLQNSGYQLPVKVQQQRSFSLWSLWTKRGWAKADCWWTHPVAPHDHYLETWAS